MGKTYTIRNNNPYDKKTKKGRFLSTKLLDYLFERSYRKKNLKGRLDKLDDNIII